uniref:Peptidyl-prolyl cis-trans isomerase n=1 Tax=Amazona collaria TaxID=241587 RepID=A0A8B9IWJ3_9PSIT
MAAVPPDSWQPPTVSMETTMGPLVLELYWKHAPRTCRNFAELCRRGYYNGTKFHRVIKDFMVQGGDPTGTGRGGASIYGKHFEDELHPELKFTGIQDGWVMDARCPSTYSGEGVWVVPAPTLRPPKVPWDLPSVMVLGGGMEEVTTSWWGPRGCCVSLRPGTWRGSRQGEQRGTQRPQCPPHALGVGGFSPHHM